METHTPQTTRGKFAYLFLKNLPGIMFVVALFVIAFILGAVISGKKARLAEELKAATASETLPINVVTLQLNQTTLQDKINLPGVVEPWTRLDLMAKVGGTVEELFVQEGDHVKKGQLLARIETNDYRIALDSAKAAYALAQANFTRDKTMHTKGMSPQAALDAQQTELSIAKAAMEEAELRLSRCQITAPMSGVISRLDAKIGLLLSQADPIAEILKIDKLKAMIGIPESDITAVKKLKEVEVTLQALDNEKIMAPFHFLAPAPESLAHVYRLELALDNKDNRILPGMFVRANIVKAVNDQAIAIPLYSVISRNDEHFVYVEEGGVAQKKLVELGFMEGWQVLVTSGLGVGENVIIEGHRSVEDGQGVKIIKSVATLGELVP